MLKARQKSQGGMLSYFYTVGKASVATPINIAGARGKKTEKRTAVKSKTAESVVEMEFD